MRLPAVLAALVIAAVASAELPPDCRFGAGALPEETLPAGIPHGDQIPIDHILVLMQENRSFDHYFAQLNLDNVDRARRTMSNPDPTGGPPIHPFHKHDYCEVADLNHGWNGTHREWNGGAMDGFTAQNAVEPDPSGSRTMGFYTKHDLPFYYKLYRTFAMSDRHFCAVLGPTFPNRHFLLTASAFGHISNDFPTVATEFSQLTIFDLLDQAGVSWKIYQSDIAFGIIYAYVREHMEHVRPIAEYYSDAAGGTLPQVAYIDPDFLDGGENDEHPPSNAQVGQAFVASVIGAFVESPNWPRGALFVTYDEHGGYWDHVPPPPACVPDDIPPALAPGDVQAAYDRYGIRVPFLAVSPFSRKHYVSHTTTDQTAILRFIETRFDLPALTRRDANASPLLELFDFDDPPFMRPPRMPDPKIYRANAKRCAQILGEDDD
jgi:phospholipase C